MDEANIEEIIKPSPATTGSAAVFKNALLHYKQMLEGISGKSEKLLSLLIARDEVARALQDHLPNPNQIEKLSELDSLLRANFSRLSLENTKGFSMDNLSRWRQTIGASEERWWWYLDGKDREARDLNDLFWDVIAGTLFLLTTVLAADIIRRFWDGAPDSISIFGSLVTVLITASPFTKRGREIGEGILSRIPSIPPRRHSIIWTAVSVIAFLSIFAMRFLGVPYLARFYNNQGFQYLVAGELTLAKQAFERAVALDNDLAGSYYNLASIYEEIAQPEQAIYWYQQALEHQLEFYSAYNNLGRLYLRQGETDQAIQILHTGLKYTGDSTRVDLITQYRLLSNLGWAYFQAEQYARASSYLAQALVLEDKVDSSLISSLPHYYLAQTYEYQENVCGALHEWENSLRYLGNDDPDEWEEKIRSRLEALRVLEEQC